MSILEVGSETTAQAAPAQWTETTRLLCAAAYTDGTFAQEVIEQVVEEEHRAVQVPPGVDAVPVIKHCLAALAQKTLRDRVLAADLVLAVLFTVGTGSAVFLVLGFLLAWAVVAYDVWTGTHRVVTKQLNARAFDPAQAPIVGDPDLARRAEEILERQAGNLAVYSGFLPFAGAGFDLGGWSFVVDLRKGKEEAGHRSTPQPVELLDLYARVEEALLALGMSNLTIEERVFVNGTDIRDDRTLLPAPTGRPSAGIGDAEMQRFVVAPSHRIRHYKCIRVTDWRGELVLSLFLRFAVANGRLFCEMSGFLLTPLKPELHRSDAIPAEPELKDLARLARSSLASAIPLWLRSPSVVLRPLMRQRRRTKLLKRVKRDAFFDYGAAVTVLDRVRSPDYSRYFQLLDKEMYVKVLERAILDTIVEVLDTHNIDTSELAERRSTIINNGIMVPGGSVQAESIAVGAGARIVNRMTRTKQPATSSGPGGGGGGGRNA